MALNFTGERFLPSCAGEMVYEHWHRYLFVRNHVAGRRVLDVASGEGYGSALLAHGAASVTGIDISPEAIAHARARYGTTPNLEYLCASCTSIPLPDASFDVIVSFETIEHITEHEAFLAEVERLLAPNGLFVISSPNRVEYSDRTGYKNEFHVKELDRAELKTLLDRHFAAQRWFAQRPCFQSLLWPLYTAPNSVQVLAIDGESTYPAESYFLVCCAKNEARLANVEATLSLVTDRDHSVYSEWSRTYAENRQLTEQVRVLQAALAESQNATSSKPEGLLRKWIKRLMR